MNDLLASLVSLLVSAVSFFLISKIRPLGVEIDSPKIALISALVFGLLNALVKPILKFFLAIPNFLSFGLVYLLINIVIFGLAAWIVTGFRLRNGIISAALGAFCLTIINGIIYKLFNLIV